MRILLIVIICLIANNNLLFGSEHKKIDVNLQEEKLTKIIIESDYENIDISYIIKIECDSFEGKIKPIEVIDKEFLEKIESELKKLNYNKNAYNPDVRIKVRLIYCDHEHTLCFGQKTESMLYNGINYDYNNILAKLIINIILDYQTKESE